MPYWLINLVQGLVIGSSTAELNNDNNHRLGCAIGVRIKTTMLLKHDDVLLRLNLSGCKRAWQC
jgi:hypothetical protein